MSVLFLILKIIGILILIPIVLLLILLVFPICYQIEGDFDGKTPKAQAKVSWAVIFLRAKAFYEEELNFAIRIFGIPVYDSRKDHWSVLGEHPEKDKKKGKKKRKKKDKKKPTSKKKSKKETNHKKQADPSREKIEKKNSTEAAKKKQEIKQEKHTVQEQISDKKVVQETKDITIKKTSEDVFDLTWDEKEEKTASPTTRKINKRSEDTIPEPASEESTKKDKEFFGKKIVNLLKKCYNKCKNLITKISKITNKMETIGDIFEDEEIIDAVKRIKGYGIGAVKLLLPQKLNVQITFGFEDPYHTGKALGWTVALIPIYGDHLDITPDFEKRTLKGHLKIKGSLRRYKILHLLWKVYKDKDELIKQKDRALRMIGGN